MIENPYSYKNQKNLAVAVRSDDRLDDCDWSRCLVMSTIRQKCLLENHEYVPHFILVN